jgi:hypothetical protein
MDESQVFEITKKEVLFSISNVILHLEGLTFDNFIDDTPYHEFVDFLNYTNFEKMDFIIEYLKSESWQLEEAVFDIARENIHIDI